MYVHYTVTLHSSCLNGPGNRGKQGPGLHSPGIPMLGLIPGARRMKERGPGGDACVKAPGRLTCATNRGCCDMVCFDLPVLVCNHGIKHVCMYTIVPDSVSTVW